MIQTRLLDGTEETEYWAKLIGRDKVTTRGPDAAAGVAGGLRVAGITGPAPPHDGSDSAKTAASGALAPATSGIVPPTKKRKRKSGRLQSKKSHIAFD